MAELKEARVPDIGDFDGVPVIEVLVRVGDTVDVDQGLVTLESDKATMEVPAPFAGVVREIRVKEGDEVAEGAVVAMIEPAAGGDSSGDSGGGSDAEPAKDAGAKDAGAADGASADAGGGSAEPAPRGSEPDPAIEPANVGEPDNLAKREEASHRTGDADAGTDTTARRSPPVAFDANELLPDKVPYASPAVRLFARELGVDLARVEGSARGGRITREDVQKFVKGVMSGDSAAPARSGGGGGLDLLPWPKVDFSKFGPTETRELSRIQKISGANLSRNWAMIPHVTQFEDADITGLEELRVQLNKENEKAIAKGKATKLTLLAFLIKASVAALKQFPDFNASLDATGENLVLKQYFHIGFAADTPNGLVVPVIRDADTKGVMEIAAEAGELAAKAREGKLGPAQMSGGCFSISSLGGIGGTKFTPIINAPEVAILGVSRADMKPVWNGSEFEPRLVLPLSLSYDHRVIDGAAAARFTTYLSQVLGDMRRVLL